VRVDFGDSEPDKGGDEQLHRDHGARAFLFLLLGGRRVVTWSAQNAEWISAEAM
jgi:hypothetical protein